MAAILYALLCSFGFGAASIFVNWGLRSATAMSATVVSTLINIVVLWPIIIATGSLDGIPTEAVLLFILAGVLSPALGRFFGFLSIDRLGITRSHPFMSTTPIVTMTTAIIFFGAAASIPIIAGTIICVVGVAQLTGTRKDARGRRRDFMFPIMAAIFYGLSINLRKIGLGYFSNAAAGAAITLTSGALVLVAVSIIQSGGRSLIGDRRSMLHFSGAGVCTLFAVFANFRALQLGNIIVVTPLANLSSVFSLILSYFLLRQTERITVRVVFATGLILLGASLVTIFR